MSGNLRPYRRQAFTMIEVTVSLAIVAIVGAIVAQALVWSLRERANSGSRQAALELAANILEAARAEPFANLDSAWARMQSVPTETAALLPDGKVEANVEPDAKLPGVKRVVVEIHWLGHADQRPRSVRLTTVVAAREGKTSGGTP